jgi:hypothetical protein
MTIVIFVFHDDIAGKEQKPSQQQIGGFSTYLPPHSRDQIMSAPILG